MQVEERIVELINLSNTYIGQAPIDVDNCQWVRLTSGQSDVYFGKDNYDKPTYTVAIRDVSNQQASLRAHEIFTRIRNWTDSQSALIATRTPRFAGRDDHDRSVYMFNLVLLTGGF